MFSYRLVRLIEAQADVLAAGLEEKVQAPPQVSPFRDISALELRERVYETYRHLGEWLLGKNELDIEHRYREIGLRRAQQKVPLSEIVQAIVLIKENLREFLKSEAVMDRAIEIMGDWNSCKCSRCFSTGRSTLPLWGTKKQLRALRARKARCRQVKGADNDVDVVGNGLQEAAQDCR